MPVHTHPVEPPIEVTAQIDGEGEIDPIIRQQVQDDRAGLPRRELPEEFIHRVFEAQEYALRHQGLDDDECCRRRRHISDWLDHLRWGTRFEDWCAHVFHDELRRREPAEVAAEEAKRKAADERAEVLLRRSLSPKQLKELDRRGYFHVSAAGRRFRITRGRSHNIKEVDGRSRILRTLCAHPVEQVPNADTMLAQKLWLESTPEEFFRIANAVRVRRRRDAQEIDRRVVDRMAAEARRREEERARREWRAAEEDMHILEQSARPAPAAGVEPVAAVAPEETDVRAA